jgi:hypothetical protein
LLLRVHVDRDTAAVVDPHPTVGEPASVDAVQPAIASSTILSTTLHRGWRPVMPVDPMYIPGRLRTGSRPSSTWMSSAEYPPPAPFFFSPAIGIEDR